MTDSAPTPSQPDAASQVLAFLHREAPKAHSADDLAALLNLESAAVQRALDALHAAGQVAPEVVSGYGGSAQLWTVSADPAGS